MILLTIGIDPLLSFLEVFFESKLLKTGNSKSESPGVELGGFIGHLESYLQEGF